MESTDTETHRPRTGLSGTNKAAVFLLTLDEPEAAAILRRLPAGAVDVISREIARLGEVPSLVRWQVMRETLERLASSDQDSPPGGRPLDFLASLDAPRILKLIEQEHPQTLALILAHLPPEKAGEVLLGLPSQRQIEVVRRISALGSTSPSVLHELEEALRSRIAGAGPSNSNPEPANEVLLNR
jgi:flagellar motor switch protein FliG